jgi:hypothetical protein
MKKNYIALLMTLFVQLLSAQTLTLTGLVLDENNKPIPECTVSIKNKPGVFKTSVKGEFQITASAGDILIVSYPSYEDYIVTVQSDIKNWEKTIQLQKGLHIDSQESLNSNGPILSMNNYWIGAKIGYNFTSNPDDNFIGSASIAINLLSNYKPMKRIKANEYSHENHTPQATEPQDNIERYVRTDNNQTKHYRTRHSIGIIGNIGNFRFTKDTTDSNNIKKLAQSVNGLLVGFGYTAETFLLVYKNSEQQYIKTKGRFFASTGGRFTTYKNVGIEKQTQNFAQSVSSMGFEAEQDGFKNGGAMSLSFSTTFLAFDKNQYQLIFNEEKSNLLVFDTTVILPISKQLGFFANGTFAQKESAIFSFGMILKS